MYYNQEYIVKLLSSIFPDYIQQNDIFCFDTAYFYDIKTDVCKISIGCRKNKIQRYIIFVDKDSNIITDSIEEFIGDGLDAGDEKERSLVLLLTDKDWQEDFVLI